MKKKMKLSDLKIKSFVTEINKNKANTVKGGTQVILLYTVEPEETYDGGPCNTMAHHYSCGIDATQCC